VTPRDRALTALGHREPDRVPLDLGSTHVTGIALVAYERLAHHLGLDDPEPDIVDDVQQVALPHERVLEHLGVDTRGLFPATSNSIRVPLVEAGTYWEYRDEWGLVHRMPRDGGLYFTLVESPLRGPAPDRDALARYPWPIAADPSRITGLADLARAYRGAGYCVVLKGLCAGLCEVACRLRGMEDFLCDLVADPATAGWLLDHILALKIAFWEMALLALAPWVDVVLEADDYGTQDSQLISPRIFRDTFKPRLAELFRAIRSHAPGAKLLFHSCGSVREIIPDLIEIGVDALNPVHVRAAEMEPNGLKRDFGDALCFWGGGVDTQNVLPFGTPGDVRDDVRRNVDALAPGGGYVFSTIHNIQADVPPANIVAMYEALSEAGVY